jgi:hypothetical protein
MGFGEDPIDRGCCSDFEPRLAALLRITSKLASYSSLLELVEEIVKIYLYYYLDPPTCQHKNGAMESF